MAQSELPAILYLCTGNSCRSQMAEGWTRTLHPDRYVAYSAGIEAHGLNARAVQVMQEAGIDISEQASQQIDELGDVHFDVVITVCGNADQRCPQLSGEHRRMHVPFDDPPALARDATDQQTELAPYRRVRDEIREFVARLPEQLARQPVPDGSEP